MSPTENETAVSTWSMQDTGRPSRLKGKGCTVTSFLNDCITLTIVVIRRGLSPWPTALHTGALSDELILPCCKFQSDPPVFFFLGGNFWNFWIWNWTIYKHLVWEAIISAFTGKLSIVIRKRKLSSHLDRVVGYNGPSQWKSQPPCNLYHHIEDLGWYIRAFLSLFHHCTICYTRTSLTTQNSCR